MPLNLHQRNRSPIPDWDFPARYPPRPPNVDHRYYDRDHERMVPRCPHGHHHFNHANHYANGYAPPPWIHAPPMDRHGRRLAIVRHRTTSPTDTCRRNRWHWRWLCPCFQSCKCAHHRGLQLGRTRMPTRESEREEAHPYSSFPGGGSEPDPFYCWPSPTDERQRQRRRGGREGGRVRVGVRGSAPGSRRLPDDRVEGRGRLPSPPPSPLYQCSSRIPREWGGRGRQGRTDACICPNCTGEAPDVIDQLYAGVNTFGFADANRRNAVADGILPPPNSRLSSRSRSRYERAPRPLRVRSRSRRPYRRTRRNGRDALEEPVFLELLDSASDVEEGDEPEHNVMGRRRRGRDRRRGRVGGSLGELSSGRADEMGDESDVDGWGWGLDDRMTW